MRSIRTACLIVGLAASAGCSRQEVGPCEPEARYSTARSAQPVQIPDDLSPPNESDALRLPPLGVVSGPIVAGACLEAPPPFSGESRSAGADAAATEEPSRRQARREARRQARGEAPAEPSEAAPAESEPAPAGDDERVIDN
jgi:uncharacterized lipoprotein